MAVPKRKHSSTRRDKRRANWKLSQPALSRCTQCGELKSPHRVCDLCGYYKGRSVIEKEVF